MSNLVIHKIDIGKVKTSKIVMKLLKLLLTVIVKHPVDLIHIQIQGKEYSMITKFSFLHFKCTKRTNCKSAPLFEPATEIYCNRGLVARAAIRVSCAHYFFVSAAEMLLLLVF